MNASRGLALAPKKVFSQKPESLYNLGISYRREDVDALRLWMATTRRLEDERTLEKAERQALAQVKNRAEDPDKIRALLDEIGEVEPLLQEVRGREQAVTEILGKPEILEIARQEAERIESKSLIEGDERVSDLEQVFGPSSKRAMDAQDPVIRGVAHWAYLIWSSLTLETCATRLHTTEKALREKIDARKIFAFLYQDIPRIPPFHFYGMAWVPGIERVLQTIEDPGTVDPLSLTFWFYRTNDDLNLEDRTFAPYDYLIHTKGNADPLIALMKAAIEWDI